jgi:hypothetical protein
MMEWLQTAKDKKKVQQTLDGHLADYTGKRDPTPYRCNFCHDYISNNCDEHFICTTLGEERVPQREQQ